MERPKAWPHGARVAVLVSVLFESWSEGKSPSYFTRTTPLKPGAIDHAGVQWSRYAGSEGIGRILGVLQSCKVPATIFCNALAAERHPEVIAAIARADCDIAAHGYAQDQYLLEMNREAQQATIRKSLDILERIAGKRPEGWVTPVYGWDQHTHELLAKEGLRWHADALDISHPRLEETPSGTIVALPWSEFVDNRVLRASPRDFHDVYIDTFDYLHAHEPGSLLHIGVHGHFGGRPLIAAMLLKVLRYVSGFPEVWFARHGELAQWFREAKIG